MQHFKDSIHRSFANSTAGNYSESQPNGRRLVTSTNERPSFLSLPHPPVASALQQERRQYQMKTPSYAQAGVPLPQDVRNERSGKFPLEQQHWKHQQYWPEPPDARSRISKRHPRGWDIVQPHRQLVQPATGGELDNTLQYPPSGRISEDLQQRQRRQRFQQQPPMTGSGRSSRRGEYPNRWHNNGGEFNGGGTWNGNKQF